MAERIRWVLAALAVLVAAVIPQFTDSSRVLSTAVLMFIIAALATSWNIMGGFAGQISLGHAAFFGTGVLVTREIWLNGTPFGVAMLVAVAAAATLAVVVGAPILRLRGIYFSIGTLAAAEAIRLTVANRRPGISPLPVGDLQTYSYTNRYYLALGVLLFAVAVAVAIARSKLGLGMMALRDDENAAAATGIAVFRYKLLALVISAALAALAGAAYAYFSVSIYPALSFSPVWSFDALLVTFIGGMGTILGPLAGSAFFVLVRDYLAANLVDLHVVLFGVIFILVVLLLPGGVVEGGRRSVRAAARLGKRLKKGRQP